MKKLLLLTSLLLLSAVLFAQETEGNTIDSGETKITLSKEEKKAARAAKKAEKDAK